VNSRYLSTTGGIIAPIVSSSCVSECFHRTMANVMATAMFASNREISKGKCEREPLDQYTYFHYYILGYFDYQVSIHAGLRIFLSKCPALSGFSLSPYRQNPKAGRSQDARCCQIQLPPNHITSKGLHSTKVCHGCH